MNCMPVRPRKEKVVKLQSAMEYLMTYGWAILIIAVVLGVLFQLGVFSSSSFSVRAPPGSCQVFRPSGPKTSQNVNLVGVCTGQLPQYSAQFNGQSSYVFASPFTINGYSQITETLWFFAPPQSGGNNVLFSSWGCCPDGAGLQFNGPSGSVGVEYTLTNLNSADSCQNNWMGVYSVQQNAWHFAAFTFNGFTGTLYVDGKQALTNTPTATPDTIWSKPSIGIGEGSCLSRRFTGMISNVQIYNTSISSGDIQSLYFEGIGGAPMKLTNLVAWWPLNGDVKDYSGNGNNGVPTSLSYASQWLNGYIAPTK
jgi:hypothetical protein